MTNGFYPKIELTGQIQKGMNGIGFGSMPNINDTEQVETTNFKDVMAGLSNNFNKSLNEPDKLLKESMAGNTDVDIHDVMVAMSKAELNVNLATQVTSKVIQAYDKIMQISV